jgi:hypothetical protein
MNKEREVFKKLPLNLKEIAILLFIYINYFKTI